MNHERSGFLFVRIRTESIVNDDGERRRVMEARMPGDPKECRQHARNCLRLAEQAVSPEVTRTFVDLAHSWTKLALELESAQALLAAVNDLEPTDQVAPNGRDAIFRD